MRLWRRRSADDFAAEVEAHLAIEADRLMRERGLSHADACSEARRAFGNVGATKERFYQERAGIWVEHMRRDIVHALRSLRRAPGFTVVVLATLSLGIGSVTTIFSIANTALFRPLPYPDANRIFALTEERRPGYYFFSMMSEAAIAEIRRASRTFERLAVSEDRWSVVMAGDEAVQAGAESVDSALFPMLGVRAERGRLFSAEEFREDPPVALISDALWRGRFNADEHILGRPIRIDGTPRTVIGVLPPDFRLPYQTDIWIPLRERMDSATELRYAVFGKLRRGVTLRDARAEMAAIGASLAAADSAHFPRDLIGVQDGMVERGARVVAPFAMGFIGAAICVLLIACANIAGLWRVRVTERRREMAIRAALGGTAARLFAQNLTESLILGLGGGAVGALLSVWGVKLVTSLVPLYGLPAWVTFGVDMRVLAFTFALSLVATIAFGLTPAREATRFDLVRSLKAGGAGTTAMGSNQRAARRQVVGELALALMLSVIATLLWQASRKLSAADLGFQRDRILTAFVGRNPDRYPDQRGQMRFAADVAAQLARNPAVVATATTASLERLVADDSAATAHARGHSSAASWGADDRLNLPGEPQRHLDGALTGSLRSTVVSQEYQRVLGLRLGRGRWFDATDNAESSPVAVLSEGLARQLWPSGDAVGRAIRFGPRGTSITVIGVVSDLLLVGIGREGPRSKAILTVYLKDAQSIGVNTGVLARTAGSATAYRSIMAPVIRAADPEQPVGQIRLLEEESDDGEIILRPAGAIMGVFALCALAMAVIGIYGVIAYGVSQRTREIGIRLALGAETSDVIRSVMRDGSRFIGYGLLLGLALSLGAARVSQFLLWGMSPLDPTTYAAVLSGFGAVALLACYMPARRVTRVEPLEALRSE